MDISERFKRARGAAGLTQHELAERTGIPQSSIAAYESGNRRPSEDTCQRILTTTGIRPSELLRQRRRELVDHLASLGIADVKVFGSVARGDDDEGSDLDLLVSLPPGTSLFDLVDINDQIEQIVGVDIDLVSRGALNPDMYHVHRFIVDEAIPV